MLVMLIDGFVMLFTRTLRVSSDMLQLRYGYPCGTNARPVVRRKEKVMFLKMLVSFR